MQRFPPRLIKKARQRRARSSAVFFQIFAFRSRGRYYSTERKRGFDFEIFRLVRIRARINRRFVHAYLHRRALALHKVQLYQILRSVFAQCFSVQIEGIARRSLQVFNGTRRIRFCIIPRRRFHYDLLTERRHVLHYRRQCSVRARRYRRILCYRLSARPFRACVFERNRPIHRFICRVRWRDRCRQRVRTFRLCTHSVCLILARGKFHRRKADPVAHTRFRAHFASARRILRLFFSACRILYRGFFFCAPIIMVLQQATAHPAYKDQRQCTRDPSDYLLHFAFACLFYRHFILSPFSRFRVFYCFSSFLPPGRTRRKLRPAFVED